MGQFPRLYRTLQSCFLIYERHNLIYIRKRPLRVLQQCGDQSAHIKRSRILLPHQKSGQPFSKSPLKWKLHSPSLRCDSEYTDWPCDLDNPQERPNALALVQTKSRCRESGQAFCRQSIALEVSTVREHHIWSAIKP